MKNLIVAIIVLWIPLLGLGYWLFRPRFAPVLARFRLAVKVAGVLYVAILGYRLTTSNTTSTQLETAALSFAFFGGLWVLAWIVTRSLAK